MSRPREQHERGAVMVEFALIAPVLFLLIFGVIEFAWAFSQNLDIRHGARETARLVAVNYTTSGTTGSAQSALIITEACGRMDVASGTTITLAGPAEVGNRAHVTISAPLDTLTGFFDPMLGAKTLVSDVYIRIEDDATWTATSSTCP